VAERQARIENGTIVAINANGFGFIAADRHSGEIWVRPQNLVGDMALRAGQRVEYVVAHGPLGVEAANVRPLET
jgi:cold shock CspA family protein